jgi:hypothetical protein|nr:MAG TPA: Protein of unknown function (DUF2778) [Caudoviricetes sp.]
MDILLERIAKNPTYTIGKLYLNGEYFCDTLEDPDRGLSSKMSSLEISNKKIHGDTAIPIGKYKIDMNTVSPRFGSQLFYKKVCGGKVPRLVNVPGYQGVLIHVGNEPKDTHGCLLVGKNSVKGKVTESKTTFEKLYKILKEFHIKGEEIFITIK